MNILIAEDDTTSRLLLSATLRKLGHDVVMTHDGQEAWSALQSEHYPLLISDCMMPNMDGLELCRRVRSAENRQSYSYLILLTSLGEKSHYLDGMDAGADDFITKPFDEDLLAARLRVAERIIDLHDTLRLDATHDGLTGLLNRTAIVERLVSEIDRADRDKKPLSVLLFDLDHFKQINDSCGHAIGDTVLREATCRMRNVLRAYDIIGRYGGEEFLLVAPGCNEKGSFILAERARAAIEREAIETSQGALQVTCSVGVAVKMPHEDVDSVIHRADKAMYCAKAKGRNRVEIAEIADAGAA